MHGLGNDFMVIDAVNQRINVTPEKIMALANRHTGIGFDQCLLIKPSPSADVDFLYEIINADGSSVAQCGNGARCIARFIARNKLSTKKIITVATKTRKMTLQNNRDETVSVSMGCPQLNPADIPLLVDNQQSLYTLHLGAAETCAVHAVNVGNPHAILHVPDVDDAPVNRLGKQISQHPIFPEQVNVGFMQILNPNHIKLRVFERGCGETLACGSGAVAAAVVGRLCHQLEKDIKVSLPGGELSVRWNKPQEEVLLTGPALFVYDGQLI